MLPPLLRFWGLTVQECGEGSRSPLIASNSACSPSDPPSPARRGQQCMLFNSAHLLQDSVPSRAAAWNVARCKWIIEDKAFQLPSQGPPARPRWTRCPSRLFLGRHTILSPSPATSANRSFSGPPCLPLTEYIGARAALSVWCVPPGSEGGLNGRGGSPPCRLEEDSS